MTEERKKYMASISKEERAIRLELSIQKNRIRYLKEWLEYPIHTNDKCTMLRLMQETRFIIKALKKQLPAPKIPLELNEVVFPRACSICKYPLASYRYCPICGQKLR